MDANRVSFICLLWSSLSVLLWPGLSATTSTSTLTSVLYHIDDDDSDDDGGNGWLIHQSTHEQSPHHPGIHNSHTIHSPNQAKRKRMWEQGVMTGWIKRTSHIHGTVTLLNTFFLVDDCIHAIHPTTTVNIRTMSMHLYLWTADRPTDRDGDQ